MRQVVRTSGGAPSFEQHESTRANLNGTDRIFRLAVAAAPDSTRTLSVGTYQLVASLATPSWQFWGWRGLVESPLVEFTVTAADPPPMQLAGHPTFLYRARRLPEAVRVAREWSTASPASVPAHLVLGDALLGSGDRAGARAAYDDALALAHAMPGSERPTAIHDRIDKLRRLRTP